MPSNFLTFNFFDQEGPQKMSIDTDEQFESMKVIGEIVANCLVTMINQARAGMPTLELDAIGAKFLALHGATSAPIKMYDFPGSTCISVEHAGVHGVPNQTVLKEGDLVNIDVSAEKDGFYADTGGSFVIGGGSGEKQNLCVSTRKALKIALENVFHGQPLNQMGKAVQTFAHQQGLTVIENLGGHGVGRSLHEEPEFIANFYQNQG